MSVRRCGASLLCLAALSASACVSGCGGKIVADLGDGGLIGQGSGGGGVGASSGGSSGTSSSGGGIASSSGGASSGGTSVGGTSSSGTSSSGTGGSGGSSTSSGSGGGSTGGSGGSSSTSSSSGGTSSGGTSSSGSGFSSSSSSGGSGCLLVPLVASATGFVDLTALNLVGSSFVFGDGLGPGGFPPGPCETTGGHLPSQCSLITFPPPGLSPQTTATTMCLSGVAAQVIGTPPDYSDIYGIAMALAFNNVTGTLQPYNATQNKVVGFQFAVSDLPTTGAVQVLFPEPATDLTGDAWGYTLPGDGLVMVFLQEGFGTGQLTPSFTPTFGSPPQPPFDPTMVEAIEFHVVPSLTNVVPVSNFCIGGQAALVCP